MTRSFSEAPRPLLGYPASGECLAARELLNEVRSGERSAISFAGFHGAALAFFMEGLLAEGGGCTLVVTATQEEAEELVEELQVFSDRPVMFFPPWESLFQPESQPDEEIFHERLKVLRHLDGGDGGGGCFIVAPVHALIQPVASPDEVAASSLHIRRGAKQARDVLAERLHGKGFRRVPLVLRRGEFSVRGDILDVYPFDSQHPLRIEYFGDTVDSLRHFDPDTQRSLGGSDLEGFDLLLPLRGAMFQRCFTGEEALLLDCLPESGLVALYEPGVVEERAEKIFHNLIEGQDHSTITSQFFERLRGRPRIDFFALALPPETSGLEVQFGTVERFLSEDLGAAMQTLNDALGEDRQIVVYSESDAEREHFRDILADNGLTPRDGIDLRVGLVRRGFAAGAIDVVFLTTRELFRRRTVRRSTRTRVETRVVRSFFDLEEGDLVVHLAHGIGRYQGVRQMEKDGVVQEFLEIEYRNGVRVYVPASKIDLVQKYIGTGHSAPALDKIGGTSWGRRKAAVERAIEDFAADLLETQAVRQQRPGHAYPSDTEWQRQLEASFPFDDTPDQFEATRAVKLDLESARPMDRLICGDVGYGKTEVAMRAAFKVVQSGRQVAVLVPTTVLAQQHCRTFRERLAGFPVRIEQLSRFCTPREQREIIEGARAGTVDILIGTHRMLSDDVNFRELGLVIIDEEQRFGVVQKEKLKKMRTLVELLTLTATPIPRTLHMALLGIRDISSLTTPPEGRSPIVTDLLEFDRHRVREAILRELNREGQVYFVHNRIQDIALVRHQLQQMVPEAVMEFAHGQMSEHQLEDIMVRFIDGGIDVLVSTTIIETGIDIPNVNTIFINECDRYGLADLHQLRGRVGRSRHRAYCYLILPDHRRMNPDARKRVQSIREFSQLGAGFQIALRDLEIRGAGNILGAQQSGHIAIVGYDLYCRLLERAVRRIQGEETAKPVDVEIDLNLEAFLPEEKVPDKNVRLEIYRRLSKMQEVQDVEELAHEIVDRCGALTPEMQRLLELQIFRVLAAGWGLRGVRTDGEQILLRAGETTRPLLEKCPHRIVVLSPTELAIVINDPRPGRRRTELTHELVFRTVFEWLRTERFPAVGGRSAKPTEIGSKTKREAGTQESRNPGGKRGGRRKGRDSTGQSVCPERIA